MSKHNFFADDGWAVWFDGDNASTFYIGEWLNPNGQSYMDIAIHTHGMKSVHSLNIYIFRFRFQRKNLRIFLLF